MAEQKFLGQAGTDVLVEKVKRNATDILTKQDKLPINVVKEGTDLTTITNDVIYHVIGYNFNVQDNTIVKDPDSSFLGTVSYNGGSGYLMIVGSLTDSSYSYITVEGLQNIVNGKNPIPVYVERWEHPTVRYNQTTKQIEVLDNGKWLDMPLNNTQDIQEITAQEVTDAFNA